MSGRRWKIYGLKNINIEDPGYSEIVIDGETRPILQIPPVKKRLLGHTDYRESDWERYPGHYGWKLLTAIYDDEFKEVYLSTLRRTKLYYGSKVWINCPTIYYDLNYDKELTLKADLFTNNRRVPGGVGVFKINGVTYSKGVRVVENGYVEESFTGLTPKEWWTYSFHYQGSEYYKLSEAIGYGKIIPFYTPLNKIPLIVHVPTVILSEYEMRADEDVDDFSGYDFAPIWDDGKQCWLTARVTHRNLTGVEEGSGNKYVKYPDDIPGGGYVEFYVDGKLVTYKKEDDDGNVITVSHIPINSNGYARIPFDYHRVFNTKLDETNPYLESNVEYNPFGVGVHTIVVTYTPDSSELQSKYIVTSGSGTLYITKDSNKPYLELVSPNCTYSGNSNFSLTFNLPVWKNIFDRNGYLHNNPMNGSLRLFIDSYPVKLKGSTLGVRTLKDDTGATMKDENGNDIILDYWYDLPVNKTPPSQIVLSFDTLGRETLKDYHWNYSSHHNMSLVYVTTDNVNGVDMEIEYYYHLKDFYLQVPVEIQLVSERDINEYGDNIYYMVDDTGEITDVEFYQSNRPKSQTVGNPIEIRLINKQNPSEPVNGGHIRLTFVTRTENKNMEDTTHLW